eukprot:7400588-Pyramimonas_sp.AAC.1
MRGWATHAEPIRLHDGRGAHNISNAALGIRGQRNESRPASIHTRGLRVYALARAINKRRLNKRERRSVRAVRAVPTTACKVWATAHPVVFFISLIPRAVTCSVPPRPVFSAFTPPSGPRTPTLIT